jgi:hypothetical protein
MREGKKKIERRIGGVRNRIPQVTALEYISLKNLHKFGSYSPFKFTCIMVILFASFKFSIQLLHLSFVHYIFKRKLFLLICVYIYTNIFILLK